MQLQYQTLDQCLKSTSELYGTTYQNICTGSNHYIPNGFWDYAGYSVVVLAAVAVSALFVSLAVLLIKG